MAQENYRPDIDGLRSVAVVSVLLFHVGVSAFAGGFVGVDVFFVISGFLITRLIKDQVERSTFRFKAFYMRRARRLLPTLLFTVAGTLLVASFLLSPQLLREFAGSVWAASFSLSNIFFYRQADYFDTSAILKPLLHTWSLSVEEQFYLFWPALLVLSLRYARRYTPIIVLAIGCASLAAAQHAVVQASAVFYLAPYRAFEFAIGALVVWLGAPRRAPAIAMEVGLLSGLALIVWSVLGHAKHWVTDVSVFWPCVGSAMVLYCGTARYSGLLLRNPIAVRIGLISYSLYLVHWPLIVFLKYNRFDEFTAAEKGAIVLASIVLAQLMYTYIETPFRHPRGDRSPGSSRVFLLRYAAGLSVVVAVALHMWVTDGWLWRYPISIQRQLRPDAIVQDESYTWKLFRQLEQPFSSEPTKKVLLIGDSQAADFANILAESGRLAGSEVKTLEMDMECQALISFSSDQFAALDKQDQSSCRHAYADFTTTQNLSEATDVILAFNWDDRGIPFIDRAVAELHRRGVQKVFVVGRKSQGMGGPDIVQRYGLSSELDAYSASRKNRRAWKADTDIVALKSNFVYIDLMSHICPTMSACRVLTDSHDIIFFDAAHLTPLGARYVGVLLSRDVALTF